MASLSLTWPFPPVRPFTILLLSSLPLDPLPLFHPHFPPPLFSPHLLQLVLIAFLKLLLLPTFLPPHYPPLNCSTANSLTTLPPPLVSPFTGPAADYLAAIPPPLVSPLSGAAADYSATIPPLVSPLSGAAADYSPTIPPPLVSPPSGSAADYSVHIPPPLVFSPQRLSSRLLRPYSSDSYTFPLICSAAVSSSLWRLLSPSPPSLCWSFNSRLMAAHGFNLWFVTQQSGSGAIPKPASTPTSTSSDPYADGLRAAIAETERIAATAQTTAAAAPNNAAARDLARVLSESLESTRKCLTEHLATPSPRSAPMPSAFAPSHSDLLADWLVANARASQVILACLPPTLLPQCSHIRYAKDLLGYLTERFQSQTLISVIALLRKLTSLRLAEFTTMADYIARMQTLSSQLAAQKFELSDHVCGALILTGLTPEYSVHVTLYGERPAD
ncbi:unnamed protein product [Closterium sp. NIES-65]|nr:unnamed protein product [Closterium sp. NIES-65]